MSTKASLADLIRTVADEERRHLLPPPTSHQLARYAAGELPEEEAERIRDYLALSPEGRGEVLALAAPPPAEPPSEAHRVSDEEVDEAWRSIAAELGTSLAGDASSARQASHGEKLGFVASLKWFFTFPVTVPALVTAMVVGFLGASLWQRDAPRLNVEISDLVPADQVTRSGDPEALSTVPAGARAYLWLLDVDDLTEYAAYAIEIADDGGTLVWSGETRKRTSIGNLNVEVPRGYLAPGSYRVTLFGVEAGERKLLEEYRVRVAP